MKFVDNYGNSRRAELISNPTPGNCIVATLEAHCGCGYQAVISITFVVPDDNAAQYAIIKCPKCDTHLGKVSLDPVHIQ